jgi:hypothetical protein
MFGIKTLEAIMGREYFEKEIKGGITEAFLAIEIVVMKRVREVGLYKERTQIDSHRRKLMEKERKVKGHVWRVFD